MRKIALVTVLSIARVICGQAQETNTAPPNAEPAKKIRAAEAAQHYKENVIVTGKIVAVSVRPSIVILDVDKPFPNSPFTAVVFSKATNRFGNLAALKGKDVEISGTIKEYHNKPEIIMDNSNQLVVVTNQAAVPALEQK